MAAPGHVIAKLTPILTLKSRFEVVFKTCTFYVVKSVYADFSNCTKSFLLLRC